MLLALTSKACDAEDSINENEKVQHDFSSHVTPLASVVARHDAQGIANGTTEFLMSR